MDDPPEGVTEVSMSVGASAAKCGEWFFWVVVPAVTPAGPAVTEPAASPPPPPVTVAAGVAWFV